MASNPLAARKAMTPPEAHPAEQHARLWAHVQQMQPDDLAAKTEQVGFVLPLLGKLAGDPNVTRKDVIKAAADAAGSGKIPAEQAVSFISQMPMDPAKVQPWLRGIYAANLSALVHMKAATMPTPQQAVPAQMPNGAQQ